MEMLDKLLTLRPTNAAMRLRRSALPLLNPRDLLRGMAQTRSALLCVPVYAPSGVVGALKAARDESALLGVSCPAALSERDSPMHLFDRVVAAADEGNHRRPIFVQAGPFRIRSAEESALESLAARVYRYLDAGCSLLSLDASALEANPACEAYRMLAMPADERELGLEVTAFRDAASAPALEATESLLAQLTGAAGLAVTFVRVQSFAFTDEQRALELDRLVKLSRMAQRFGVAVSLDVCRPFRQSELACWLEAGVRKVDATEAVARVTASALPREVTARLREKAEAAGVHWSELLGPLSDGLTGLDPAAAIKVEALMHEETSHLLERLGASGLADQVAAFLCEQGG